MLERVLVTLCVPLTEPVWDTDLVEDELGEPVGLRVDVPLTVGLGLPVWDAVTLPLGVEDDVGVWVSVWLALPL